MARDPKPIDAAYSGRLRFTASPLFLIGMTVALLGPAAALFGILERTEAPFRNAAKIVAGMRWMPHYAELRFFRETRDGNGTERALLIYQARGEALESALDRIPVRRLERWSPGADSATLAALRFLADTLGAPAGLLPEGTPGPGFLFCRSPFEAPGCPRHRSFALADTARGTIWIGRSRSVADAPLLAKEAFYQASNSTFAISERADLNGKIAYLEAHAPGEPWLKSTLAMRYAQSHYRYGSPFEASSYREGTLEHAIGIEREALQRDEGYCLGYSRLARYHSILEDFEPARENLRRAAACGEDIHYLAAKALYHFRRGETDSAREAVTRLENGDFGEKAYYPYEEIVREQMRKDGNLDAAEKILARLILLEPGMPQPYGNFAEYLIGEYRFDEAVVLCDRLKGLGEYPIGTRVCEEAERKWERYGERRGLVYAMRKLDGRLRNGEDIPAILRDRIRALSGTRLEFLALADMARLSARAPDPGMAALEVGLREKFGDRNGAEADCAELSLVHARSAALACACGKSEYHFGHAAKAREYLLAARNLDTSSGPAALYLGYLEGDSVAAARKALGKDPNLAEAMAILGLGLLREGDYPGAAAKLGEALEREPENLDWLTWHGEALAKGGDPEAALADLNGVLRRVKGRADALRARIAAYRDLGATGLAWTDYRRLFRSGGAVPGDSARWKEWMAGAALDTAALNDPLYSVRAGFTRNIVESKPVDRPGKLSLKAMANRRLYLRMYLERAAGKRYDLTYAIKDGKGRTSETGDLPITIKSDRYSMWFSHRFERSGEEAGNWIFNLYRKGELVAAETMRLDP